MKEDLYAEDGVNINVGDKFSEFCGDICRSTYNISPFVDVKDFSRGHFRGPRGFRYKNLLDGHWIAGAPDGIGTKVVPIVASGKLQTAASNVIAMTAMDITRWGGIPLVFLNVLDVASLGEYGSETFRLCQEIMFGLQKEVFDHDYVIYSGETAELGTCVGSDIIDAKVKFNWAGVMLGAYHEDKMILGDTLAPGQMVIVLRDKFRSNGISSVRKALARRYGPQWWDNPEAFEDIIASASPSVQYDRMLNFAHGWYQEKSFVPAVKIHLVVHLSGGAFESKFGKDMLEPQGLAVELDNLFDPPPIMKKCAEWRGMTPEQSYRTWNGGQGAAVVIEEKDKDLFLNIADKYGIEAKVAGRITAKTGKWTVKIHSKFGDGEVFEY